MRVPMVAWAPGLVNAGTRVDPIVMNFDVMPTVLELAMRLCSDCVAQAHGLKATNFPWLSPKLMWVKSIGIERFSQLYQNLQKEFRLANHPINPRLALEYVGQQWQNLTK